MAMSRTEIETMIREAFPDARIEVKDLAGDGNHYSASVVTPAFKGMSRVKQHQMVYAALKGRMGGRFARAGADDVGELARLRSRFNARTEFVTREGWDPGAGGLATAFSLQQGKVQRISRVSADLRSIRPEKPSDSRLFRDNSLLGRSGSFLAHQGSKVPCPDEYRDNSCLLRAASPAP